MAVLNVHQRMLSAPPDEVGTLIDTLAGPDDRLWPHSTWPTMRFDRPLAAGAVGGHGPISYVISHYLPGRWIRFTFTGPEGSPASTSTPCTLRTARRCCVTPWPCTYVDRPA